MLCTCVYVGIDLGWEEYYDYIFPDDSSASGPLKILEMARLWKKQKLQQMQEDNETEEMEGEGEGEGEQGDGEGDAEGEGEGQEEEEEQEEGNEAGPARPAASDSPPARGGDDEMED